MTAQNAGKVLAKDIYWTVPFLRLYLDRCDELGMDRPAEGLALARHAPNLARQIRTGSASGQYRSQRQKHSYEVFALAVLASLYRRNGQIAEAERTYDYAVDVVSTQEVVTEAHGELLRRYGYLATSLGRENAIEYLDQAVELLESCAARRPNYLADALNTRGHWYANRGSWRQAGRDFSRAMLTAKQNDFKGRLVARDAVVNMAFTVAQGSLGPHEQAKALNVITIVKREMSRQPLSHAKCKLQWMEGILIRNMHFHRPAARILERARRGLLKLGQAFDFALVSLDLAEALVCDGETSKYERLRVETAAAFESIAGDEQQQILTALERWKTLPSSEQAIQRIRAQVETSQESQRRQI